MTKLNYPSEYDWVWLAIDGNENLAALCTAGVAPVPANLVKNSPIDVYDIGDVLSELPQVSEVRLCSNVKWPDSFIFLAQRGLYVFDWSDIHKTCKDRLGAYEHMASPKIPLARKSLPETLQQISDITAFGNIDFSGTHFFDPRQYTPCLEPE